MTSPLPRLFYHRVMKNSMWAMLSHTQRKPLNPGCFRMGCPNHGLWFYDHPHQRTINEPSMRISMAKWTIFPADQWAISTIKRKSPMKIWTINENQLDQRITNEASMRISPLMGKYPYPRSHQCHHYPHHFACDSKKIITGWGPDSVSER